MGQVIALVGAQFGSEGKGLIAEKISDRADVFVRTGAPNAGHTYFVSNPADWGTSRVKVVARSVPVGACQPDGELVIGAGAFIDLEALLDEMTELDSLGLDVSSGRLLVDAKATIIDPIRHHRFEGGTDGDAHKLIGSTGEGVGPARMAKISRGTFIRSGHGPSWARVDQVSIHRERLEAAGVVVCDTVQFLNDRFDRGGTIMLEGTQGSGLSLVHGPWPYVTSTDTNAAQLAVDAGLAPQLLTETILVTRTFPIRVAGNSGPLPNEITWEELGQPEERTTVTKKVRRVARMHVPTVRRAIMLNRPRQIALTFADYVWPELANRSQLPQPQPDGFPEWFDDLQSRFGVRISMLGTGPDTVIDMPFIRSVAMLNGPWPSADDAVRVEVEA